jgi:large subunit ribosomal protein L4
MDQKGNATVTPATLADLGLQENHVSVAPIAIARYVRMLRQNWRQGTVSCKGRSDVSYSGAKPWKQKGTGRARSGGRRSPLWRHGGVIFGPQPRVRTLDLPVKVRRGVMRSLLHEAVTQSRVYKLERPVSHELRTADARRMLQQAGLWGKKIALLININDFAIQMAFGNIPEVALYCFDQLNGYALSDAAHIVYFHNNNDEFKKVVQSWI